MHRTKIRKKFFNLPIHKRTKLLNINVAKELREKLGRTVRVKIGDVVKVMRGNFKGKEGKVVELDTKKGRVAIEGIARKTASGKEAKIFIHASNLMLIKKGEENVK